MRVERRPVGSRTRRPTRSTSCGSPASTARSPAPPASGAAGRRLRHRAGARARRARSASRPRSPTACSATARSRLADGALVLVEDLTEARRREAEIKVKEATIREVHHRVKNNLQTIASLLRIQARRTDSEEARHALAEATERVASMAVVHDLLAGSDEERVDFAEAARDRRGSGAPRACSAMTAGVSRVRRGHDRLRSTRTTATSLALALAELVHNAIEHGIVGRDAGKVEVTMRRVARRARARPCATTASGCPTGFDAGRLGEPRSRDRAHGGRGRPARHPVVHRRHVARR